MRSKSTFSPFKSSKLSKLEEENSKLKIELEETKQVNKHHLIQRI